MCEESIYIIKKNPLLAGFFPCAILTNVCSCLKGKFEKGCHGN
uniref:Uncharacterized protein n=1 Tax=Rhizophora mucronata TaxID=61149 RepID=A0A2P2QPT1_RHIMU